ncbi:MAG: ferredoxin--NADP reductase [Polyangiales bacterium]
MPTENTQDITESPTRAPLRVTVARVVEETADARSFVLDVSDPALRAELDYRAGQYVTVEIPWETFHIHRCYSFSSAPGVDAQPQFTVKRVAEGRMSNALIDGIKAGDTLALHPPAGRFVLDRTAGARPLSLFAGGSGVTPIFALLKSTLRETQRPVRMLYANRDAASTIFAAQLDALAREHAGRFELQHHHDDANGFLTPEALGAWLDGAPDGGTGSDHYVCGPTPFMDAVEAALNKAGVPSGHVRVERFVSPADPDRRDTEPVMSLGIPPNAESPDDFLVTLGSSIRRVPYTSPLTLLQACKAAGVKAPSSCEDGFCGSCMCQLVEGDVAMANPLALTDNDVARGRVLACQARPTSAKFLHVDFDAVSFKAGAGEGMAPPLSPARAAAVLALCVGAAFLVRWLHAIV